MKYLLLNKNHIILVFEFDENYNIGKIWEEIETEYVPYGLVVNRHIDLSRLNSWWCRRSIPASRKNLELLLSKYHLDSNLELIAHSYGLSLSDHYWVRPEGEEVCWEDINYFDNEFSEDMGRILFDGADTKGIEFNSPDNTSEGNLPKCWKIINGRRILLKKGDAPYFQEPFNEVIAAKLCNQLGISCAKTWLVQEGNEFCSASENFITKDTELVSAWQLLTSGKKPNHLNNYQFLQQIAQKENIPGFEEGISSMLVMDYIINNEDRHFRNFGFIRNVETLEFEGMAPLFDNGACIWYSNLDRQIGVRREVKPFNSDANEQIRFIKSTRHLVWDRVTPESLEPAFRILEKNDLISQERIKLLMEAVWNRLNYLSKIMN